MGVARSFPAPSPRTLASRAAAFLALFAFLQLSWQALHGTWAERLAIHDATVVPAAFLINLLTPAIGVRATDSTLQAPGGGLSIQNGCEGAEAFFLLYAAFAVAPLGWGCRWRGALLGSAVVFVTNQARILLLFYSYRADHAWFDPLHAMVTPIGVVVVVCCYFYAWLVHSNRRLAQTA